MSWPRCSFKYPNGTPCKTITLYRDSAYCPHHTRPVAKQLAKEWAESDEGSYAAITVAVPLEKPLDEYAIEERLAVFELAARAQEREWPVAA